MGTILKIALRNLSQHMRKSIIIGMLIVISISLGLVGNTVLDSAKNSMVKTFTENFTGDVLILPKEINGGIFGASGGDDSASGPPILPMMKDYDKVYSFVSQRPEIQTVTSQISSYVLYNFQDDGINFGLTFGIEPENYQKTFDNIVILEGRTLKAGEEGILLHEKVLKTFREENAPNLKLGDTIQLNNFGEAGFKIREVPIVGIFKFKAGNERAFSFMQPCFVDVNTLRALKGSSIINPEDIKLNPETQKLVDSSEEDFFGDDPVKKSSSSTKVDLNNPLGDKVKRLEVAASNRGAWNYILIKLKPGESTQEFIKKLNAEFEEKKLEVKAQDWFNSAQPDSGVFWAISLVFNIIIWLLAIVSVIIIMNTLVVSVMERTPEIGTMRALGAQKGFVRTLFVYETLVITVVSGAIGIVVGFLLIVALNITGISAPNDFMKLIFGGNLLRPAITLNQIGTALSIIIFIGLTSWIIPVRMALKVSPLKAIASE